MKFSYRLLTLLAGVLFSMQSFASENIEAPLMPSAEIETAMATQWGGGCSQPADPSWFIFPQTHYPVQVQTWVNWNSWQVRVNFQHGYPFPVICHGTLYGRTYHGRTGYLNFHLGPFHAGVTAYAYMNTVYGDPVVNGWANATCYSY